MSNYVPKVSEAWNLFTYANFIVAAGMMTGGIYFLEASFSAKGFYSMAALMLVYSTAGITKALRDGNSRYTSGRETLARSATSVIWTCSTPCSVRICAATDRSCLRRSSLGIRPMGAFVSGRVRSCEREAVRPGILASETITGI